ncbi:GNAT family N-acetyltransferase [Wohlfahrtiimonas larvae]|uniref:GNAT family N-acetyltransferase n=1 Tax=Wohlfahrtiimonas larvae TaxID=1157986 RepID=A0ABP9N3K4_9GAMM|nr:GNAT family N-acetyltransferase [Wohlfahrtiimonas larvae]
MDELSIQIREARSGDVEYLPEIERSAAQIFKQNQELAWLADHDVQPASLHQNYIQARNSWVAVHDDIPVGFINGVEYNKTFHICELSVTEAWQSQGVGRALLQAVEQIMQERGITIITLTTFKDIPWNAPFYERQGYEKLEDEALSIFLTDILDEEIESGFEPHSRCAMQKQL